MPLPVPPLLNHCTTRRALTGAVLLAGGVLLGSIAFRPATQNPEATARAYLRYREVLTAVDRDYADSVDPEALTDYAIRQLLARLDPHSTYIAAAERAQTDAFLQSDQGGVGLEFNFFRDTMTVVATVPGGPAAQAGVLPGDQVLRVAGQPVAGAHLAPPALARLLRGAEGSALALDLHRRGQPTPLRLALTRNRLPSPSVDVAYLLDAETGYIKISRFAANTPTEFKQALAGLRRQGLARLVLDLRGNPGGYLDRATTLADEFIAGSRKLVTIDGRDEQYRATTYARVAGDFEDGPLVLLIDENSASAAEVLAGAVQDHDRALLVGRRTFGKGLVQKPIALSDGGELRLTVARYYTPAGRSIQKPYGLTPADYRNELATREKHGEMAAADSNQVARLLRFRTDHGRPVYGGGGIMPDVFVPRDSLTHSRYYRQLLALGVLRAEGFAFVQQHRAELQGLRPDQFQQTFRVSDAQLTHLQAQAAGAATDAAAARRCAPLLRTTLKAEIARSAYGAEAYFRVLGAEDADLQAGVRALADTAKLR